MTLHPTSGGMSGLTVRWSLAEAPDGAEIALAQYVEETSHARFSGIEGLRFKTWRMRAGEWFEGCYVFDSSAARDAFQALTAAQQDQIVTFLFTR